ncbi:MAG: TetR/AcrR family transcriptional regulator [Actinomycetota bacterium]
MKVRSRKVEQAEATRTELLRVARELFTSEGFAETSTEELVQRAGVTRGALYHHFASKEELLRDLVMEIGEDLTQKIHVAATNRATVLEGFIAGCEVFLDACLDPSVQRILIIEAPAVLGADEMRQIDERCWLSVMKVGIAKAIDAGEIVAQPVETLARVMLGAMYEGALHIARADDHVAARQEVGTILRRFLSALVVNAGAATT